MSIEFSTCVFRAKKCGHSGLLLIVALMSFAAAVCARQSSSAFAGVWMETRPQSGPPMRLKLTENGSQLEVRMSYTGTFGDQVFGVATIYNNMATWSSPQGCAPRFRTAGYDYSNPGVNTFTLVLKRSMDSGIPTWVLHYKQTVQWNAPCGGHPVGTELIRKVLTKAGE
jgi:hypothetical protein